MRTVVWIFAAALWSMTAVMADDYGHPYTSPPGRLVDVGGHRLHIDCRGVGSPTVLVDTGLGDVALTWRSVQDRLARHTKTCVYDRAGYGYSDPGPLPRTTSRIVDELHALVTAARLTPPFVLVGHSFGGYNVRYYASRFPDEVAALVLVDAAHPNQHAAFPVYQSSRHCLMSPNARCRHLVRPVIPENLPESAQTIFFMLLASPKHRATYLSELRSFEASALEVLSARALPDIPIIVVSRGRHVWPETQDGYTKEAIWQGMQADLETLSRHSTQIRDPQSGHMMHLDNPALVSQVAFSAVIAARLSLARTHEVFFPGHLAGR